MPVMPPREAQSLNRSAPQDDPTQLLETQNLQSSTLEQYQTANDVLSLDNVALNLDAGANSPEDNDYHGLYPIDPFHIWNSPIERGTQMGQSQFSGLDPTHIDPALAIDYASLGVDNGPQLGLSDAMQADDRTNSWAQFASPVPPFGTGFQVSVPREADFHLSQMGQLSMMDYSRGSLPRRRSQYLRSSVGRTAPISIANATPEPALDPMQRWKDSPPETEAASLSAIAGALKTALPRPSSCESLRSRAGLSRAASTASFNSERTSQSSKSATSARSSISRDFLSRPSTRGGVSKGKRTNTKGNPKERRMFQCTFCCDSFKSKYDWSRHEKSLHLSLDGWVCTPNGGAVVSPDTARSHCAYCNMLDPTPEHLETHNYSICQPTDSPHIFNRKDHLVQHLRLAHQLDTLPLIDNWRVEAPPIKSRCGICDKLMDTWPERVDHISQHFRKGKTMEDWKGDHCFEPSIAAMVANALPPYLIGAESRSLVPFSATDSGTKDHYIQIHDNHLQSGAAEEEDRPEPMPPSPDENPTTTFVNVLTLGLARFARRNMRLGVMPTDEMFQKESRRLVYGSEDAWDQTIADNTEWLSSFRSKNMAETMEDELQ